jgi:hypothetical protein
MRELGLPVSVTPGYPDCGGKPWESSYSYRSASAADCSPAVIGKKLFGVILGGDRQEALRRDLGGG